MTAEKLPYLAMVIFSVVGLVYMFWTRYGPKRLGVAST